MAHQTNWKKNSLSAAVALALGGGSNIAPADVYEFNFDGLFTMLNAAGAVTQNNSYPYYGDATWEYGKRTQIAGTLSYDTDTGTGSITIGAFEFFAGSLPAEAQNVTFSEITGTDLPSGETDLWLTNMLFNWNGTNGIPVSAVHDASGLKAAIAAGAAAGDTIDQTTTEVINSGAAPASDLAKKLIGIPIGVAPLVNTSWDTTPTCTPSVADECLTTNPSGGFPLLVGALGPDISGGTSPISGSPMIDGPFSGSNANFDFTSLTITSITDTNDPVISLTGAATINLTQGDAFTDPGASCSDPVNNEVLTVNIGGDTVDVNTLGTYVITYDCTDSAARTATQLTRSITVVAPDIPLITLLGANPFTLEAPTPFVDPGATAADSQGTDLTANIVVSGSVNVNVLGSYTLDYDVVDTNSTPAPTVSRTVDVVDTTAPVIALSPACPITIEAGDADPTPTASANDSFEGDLTGSIIASGTVNTTPDFDAGVFSQDFTLTWSATDNSGNSGGASCDITVGRPEPIATLVGDATQSVNEGDAYTDPGATCEDFADGVLANAIPDTIIDTTSPGTQTINYTCGPDNDGNTSTVSRNVIVQGGSGFSASPNSGSTFIMINQDGNQTGTVTFDIFASWDGSLNTSESDTNVNMTLGSAGPTPFFGSTWAAHTVRVFGPGSYSFDVDCTPAQITAGITDCPVTDTFIDNGVEVLKPEGRTLDIEVGPNQLGGHMLFNWNATDNIDVALVWDINGAFIGAPVASNNEGVKGQIFNLSSGDGNGDNIAGINMADGPFETQNANFNINFQPPYTLTAAQAPLLTATQGGNTTRTIIADSGNSVVLSVDIGDSFDWSASDSALLTAGGATDQSSFSFDPAGLAAGVYTASVTINAGTSNESINTLTLRVLASDPGLGDFNDDDNDGIPNYQDSSAVDTVLQLSAGNNDAIVSSAGKLAIGQTAFTNGSSGAGLSTNDIGISDTGAEESCVGGCFDFEVSGLALRASVQVVLPLSEAIPANAEYRKNVGGNWQPFADSDPIASAARVGGSCPAPGDAAYRSGANEGDECLAVTISDGGPNDADGTPNGIVRDPGGIAIAAAPPTGAASIDSPSVGGGCTLSTQTASAAKHSEWWLLTALLGWLGLRKRSHR